jgi:hypothetical protein
LATSEESQYFSDSQSSVTLDKEKQVGNLSNYWLNFPNGHLKNKDLQQGDLTQVNQNIMSEV